MSDEKRREVTPQELRDPNINLPNVRVEGMVTIFDKDGNVKSKFAVTSEVEPNEEGQCN